MLFDMKTSEFSHLFLSWIRAIIQSEKPGKKIIAYKFGISETPDVPSGYFLYLIGANNYDKRDDDWASGMGDFCPEDTYLALPEKEFKNKNWEAVQLIVEKEIKKFISSPEFDNTFFKKAKAIAVGFDDGDLKRIM